MKRKKTSKKKEDFVISSNIGYVSGDWISPDEDPYIKDDKCPHAKNPGIKVVISTKVENVFRYMHHKLPGREWALYLLAELNHNVYYVVDYVLKPQKSSGAHVVFIRDGMPTSYRDDVQKEHPNLHVGNVHSHNNMGVFASGEDKDVILVDGEFACIVNAREDIKAWSRIKLPCGKWALVEVDVEYESRLVEEEDIDFSLIQPEIGRGYGDTRYNLDKKTSEHPSLGNVYTDDSPDDVYNHDRWSVDRDDPTPGWWGR